MKELQIYNNYEAEKQKTDYEVQKSAQDMLPRKSLKNLLLAPET